MIISVSATAVQALALPTKVDRRSTASKVLCIELPLHDKGAVAGALRCHARAAAFRSGLLRAAVEVAVRRHLVVDHVVGLPLRRALREDLLRIEYLLEERVLAALLVHDLVPGVELRAQDRVGRLLTPCQIAQRRIRHGIFSNGW